MSDYDPFSDPEALFSTKETSLMTGRSVSALQRDRHERVGIPFIRINRNNVKYRRGDIIAHNRSYERVEVQNCE